MSEQREGGMDARGWRCLLSVSFTVSEAVRRDRPRHVGEHFELNVTLPFVPSVGMNYELIRDEEGGFDIDVVFREVTWQPSLNRFFISGQQKRATEFDDYEAEHWESLRRQIKKLTRVAAVGDVIVG